MSERPKREKKLAPQLLAFFETKNPTGFFARVAASRKQERDVADIEESEEKEDCEKEPEKKDSEDTEKSLAGIIANKDIFKTKLKTITAFTQVRPKLLEAVEKQTKVLFRTQDAICIICYEKNTLPDSLVSSSNYTKHFRRFHEKLLKAGYQFKNITQLKGLKLTFSDSLAKKAQTNKLRFEKALTAKVYPYLTYVSAVADFLVANGVSLSAVDSPQFHSMLESYRTLSKTYDWKIDRNFLRDTIITRYELETTFIAEAINSDLCNGYPIAVDCYDWSNKIKILGVTLRLVVSREDGFFLRNYPFMFAQLTGEDDEEEEAILNQEPVANDGGSLLFETLSSGEQLSEKVRAKMDKYGIPISKLSIANGDGAKNAISCSASLTQQGGAYSIFEKLGDFELACHPQRELGFEVWLRDEQVKEQENEDSSWPERKHR